MHIIKFTIPIAPVSKKNHQQIVRPNGRPCIVQSKQYRDYEKAAMLYIPKTYSLLAGPVTVKALFYMPTRRRVDKLNLQAALDDILVRSGLLADDSCTVIPSHDGSRVFYDKEHPRTEVEITSYEGLVPW